MSEQDYEDPEDEDYLDEEDDEESGSGGGGHSFWTLPEEKTPADNKANSKLAQQLLALTRIDLKTQGYEVDALSHEVQQKIANAANKLENDGAGAGGLNTLAHPDLAFLGGKADKTILPKSVTSDIANDLNMDADVLTAKQAAENKHKLKHKLALRNKLQGPKQRPKHTATPRNTHTPKPKPNI